MEERIKKPLFDGQLRVRQNSNAFQDYTHSQSQNRKLCMDDKIDKNLKDQCKDTSEALSENPNESENVSLNPQPKFHQGSIFYRPEIDGLRTIAVLPVIFYHFHMFETYTLGGFGGVDVFFVISGFLVNSIIISDILKQKFSFSVFYERRVRRLFPAMFTLFTTLLIVGLFLYYEKKRYQQLVREVFYALLSGINVDFYLRTAHTDGYWGDQSRTWPLLHFWSLAVEEQFYLFTPLLLTLISKIFKKDSFLLSSALCYTLMIVVSFILSVQLTDSNSMFAFYLIFCRAWQLGLGALMAVLLHAKTLQKIEQNIIQPLLGRKYLFSSSAVTRIILQILSWAGLLMIFWSYVHFNDEEDAFPGYKALLPCSGAFIFIGATFVRTSDERIHSGTNEPLLRQIVSSAYLLSLKPMVWVGKISYSLYLWHWPIWLFTNYYYSFDSTEVPLISKFYTLQLTFVAAYISTKIIQNPMRDKKVISKKILWRFFGICWVGIMLYTCVASSYEIGGILYEVDNQINLDSSNDTSLKQYIYPLKDSEGELLLNPYSDFDYKLIELESFLNSPDEQVLFKYEFTDKFKKPRPPLLSYFINYNGEKLSNEKQASKRVCILTLGNSHTWQHSVTMQELALEYNTSLMMTILSGSRLQFDLSDDLDRWRLNQLKYYKPSIVFAQEFWEFYFSNKSRSIEQIVYSLLDPILGLDVPPKLIVLFGDNPSTNINLNFREDILPQFLQRLYISKGQSWQFLENVEAISIQKQIAVQKEVQQIISSNYDTNVVKYYPHLHQFMQNPHSGIIQYIGSEVGGELLYFDRHHLSLHGSRRYKKYITSKIFEKAKTLCEK